jgi:hypothetical protein
MSGKDLSPLPSSPAPSPALPATNPQPKARPIPRKVRQAIELIVTGQVRTQKQAAKRVGLARETLSRHFARRETQEAMRSRAQPEVALGAGRAAARLNQLIDSSSQKVALDATKYCLGVAGIKPASEPVSVNVGVQVAGYVIDLRERNNRDPLPNVKLDGAGGVVVDSKAIDAKPAG